jgi:medium-chain acyl-[acyl-carrier-protein] hydrolase
MSRWLRCLAPRPMASRRLVCFPWAGGGPSGFRHWPGELPPDVEVWACALPGHEGRLTEAPTADLVHAARTAAAAIAGSIATPVILYGHSLGAWLAFETARAITAMGRPRVDALIVSGRRAPTIPILDGHLAALDDASFIAEVGTRYGGLPADVAAMDEIVEALLPALRADFGMLDSYAYPVGPPLAAPIHVLAGADDPHTAPADWLEAWRRETSGTSTIRRFPGGHFFIETARGAVLDHIRHAIAAATPS